MHRRSSHHMAVLLAAAQAMFYAQMVFKQPYHNSVFYQMLQSNPECCHIPSFLQDLGELPTQSTPLAPYIANNPKLFPFFKGALGALDGTHILHALLLQINPAITITKEGSHRMSWLPLHSTCTFSTSSVNGMEVPQMGVSFMMHIFMTWRSQMESTT